MRFLAAGTAGAADRENACCPRHRESLAIGTCSRCGGFLCSACVSFHLSLATFVCPECVAKMPKRPGPWVALASRLGEWLGRRARQLLRLR